MEGKFALLLVWLAILMGGIFLFRSELRRADRDPATLIRVATGAALGAFLFIYTVVKLISG
ncbi:MAG: hypothetical protein R2694_03025 [Ilumatobacteraceae bacterium]|nr:hypothetical protein [Ilumatobacter sp.]MCB0983735.1 hypothetical protein [Ilumatobacter sp.]